MLKTNVPHSRGRSPSILREGIRISTPHKMSMLITTLKRPNVRKTKGKARTLSKGLRKMFPAARRNPVVASINQFPVNVKPST